MQNLNQDLVQFLEQLKARGVSANTQKAYNSDINDLLTFLLDTKQLLDLEAIRSWLYRISEAGASKATLARKTSAIKSFTAWRADLGLADQDPALRLRSPKLDSRCLRSRRKSHWRRCLIECCFRPLQITQSPS
jgi:integrase/recombinase XerC